jgi:hypothetical protein
MIRIQPVGQRCHTLLSLDAHADPVSLAVHAKRLDAIENDTETWRASGAYNVLAVSFRRRGEKLACRCACKPRKPQYRGVWPPVPALKLPAGVCWSFRWTGSPPAPYASGGGSEGHPPPAPPPPFENEIVIKKNPRRS